MAINLVFESSIIKKQLLPLLDTGKLPISIANIALGGLILGITKLALGGGGGGQRYFRPCTP